MATPLESARRPMRRRPAVADATAAAATAIPVTAAPVAAAPAAAPAPAASATATAPAAATAPTAAPAPATATVPDAAAPASSEAPLAPPGMGGMVPPPSALPDVLPTDRLLAGAKAVPEIRARLRAIPNWRSAIAVVSVIVEPIAVIAGAIWLSNPIAWVVAFVLMGRAYARFATLGHEAVHRTLFTNRAVNDRVGRWLLSYPSWVPFELYRRAHIDHHRDEMGPKEPDLALYRNYPVTRSSFRRKLIRDATGQTGWKLFRGLLRAARKRKPTAVRILLCQLPILAAFIAIGRPELYFFLWWLPHQTVWRVINRLRAVAEHGGMMRSSDRRQTTHHARQSPIARFFMVPYNIGFHLAHHVDMGVSCWHLPEMHDELVRSGWVTDEYVYPSYRSLWKALASG